MNTQCGDDSIRILIADDDEHILECYREAFCESEATDYMQALNALDEEMFDTVGDIEAGASVTVTDVNNTALAMVAVSVGAVDGGLTVSNVTTNNTPNDGDVERRLVPGEADSELTALDDAREPHRRRRARTHAHRRDRLTGAEQENEQAEEQSAEGEHHSGLLSSRLPRTPGYSSRRSGPLWARRGSRSLELLSKLIPRLRRLVGPCAEW